MSWFGRLLGRSPQKQLATQSALEQVRTDGWRNVLTGLGTAADKRSFASIKTTKITDIFALELWRYNDICKRIIELLPREEMRQGHKLKIAGDTQGVSEDVMALSESLHYSKKFEYALQRKRAFGGAALFPVIEGAQGPLATPLDESSITRIKAFHVLEPRELFPVSWYNSLDDEKFGEPSSYRFVPLTPGGMPAEQMMEEIHESRLIIFQGIKNTRLYQAGDRYGWGDSVLTAPYDVIRDFGLTWEATAMLMQSFSQAVLKLQGLGSLVAADQDRAARDRLAQISLLADFMKMIVIDMKDEFKREVTPMSGFSDVLDRFWVRLGASVGWPATVISGEAPAGLNATGEGDREFFYDVVRGEQQSDTDNLERGYKMMMLSIDGPCKGKEPSVWSCEWNALWAPTAKEIADTRLAIANADHLRVQDEILMPEECRSHWQGDTWSDDIVLDDKAYKAQQKQLDATPDPAALAAMGYAPIATPADPSVPADPAIDDAGARTVVKPKTVQSAKRVPVIPKAPKA